MSLNYPEGMNSDDYLHVGEHDDSEPDEPDPDDWRDARIFEEMTGQ